MTQPNLQKDFFCLKSIFIFSVLLLFNFFPNQSNAQTSSLDSLKMWLRDVFVPLKPNPSPEFLYDMAVHFTDSNLFTNYSTDTISTDDWFMIYQEMRDAAYDTSWLDDPELVYKKVLQKNGNIIPIGIMDFDYLKLKPDALNSDKYFNFDTINNTITDKPGRLESPYLEKNLFVAAPLFKYPKSSNVKFSFYPEFLFYDNNNVSNYALNSEVLLKANFDDGQGWRVVDMTQVFNDYYYFEIDYDSVGIKEIKIALTDTSGQILKLSTSYLNILTLEKNFAPDQEIDYKGMRIGVFNPCDSLTGSERKIVIMVEGFDPFDAYLKLNTSASDIYLKKIQQPEISQLRNFGYEFWVIDWKQSLRSMELNAMDLVDLIDSLKCAIDNEQQFVVMGTSMGGLISRYALLYMESPAYYDNAANCQPHKMHNTRLFITMDTGHKGVNVPMSAQAFYKDIFAYINFFRPNTKHFLETYNLFLDGEAAKQMMLIHIDTETDLGNNVKAYSPHQKHLDYFDAMEAMGNYPQYCKKVAISNGSLAGTRQFNHYTNTQRTPGDNFVDLDYTGYARVLGIKIPVFKVDMELKSNHNDQTKHFYKFIAGQWTLSPRFYWFGVEINTGFNSIYNVVKYANLPEYCISAGGFEPKDGGILIGGEEKDKGFEKSNFWSLMSPFSYHTSSSANNGVGCWSHQNYVGYAYKLIGFESDISICSDGLHFTLVPMQSAIAYDGFGDDPLNKNIEAEDIDLKLSKTPFDVIIGIEGGAIDANQATHSHVENKKLPSPYDEFIICEEIDSTLQTRIINREIGDEQLYLENAYLNWNASYQTQFDIFINQRSPFYEYPSQVFDTNNVTLFPYILPGIYSKEAPFIIDTDAQATFKLGIGNGGIFNYEPPFSGPYEIRDSSMVICCKDYSKSILWHTGLKIGNETELIFDRKSKLKVFPNPNTVNGILTINYQFHENLPANISIYNAQGKLITVFRSSLKNHTQNNFLPIDLSHYNLKPGLYLIKVFNYKEQFTQKIIIQN